MPTTVLTGTSISGRTPSLHAHSVMWLIKCLSVLLVSWLYVPCVVAILMKEYPAPMDTLPRSLNVRYAQNVKHKGQGCPVPIAASISVPSAIWNDSRLWYAAL